MADTKEIIVTLKLADGGEDKANSGLNVGNPEETSDSKNIAKAVYKTLGVQAVNIVVNEAVAWAEYAWNKELVLNDDYIGQRQKQIAMQCINKSIGFASSVLSGAAMGSALGPVGAVVGAALGATSAVLSTVRENVQAMDQQDIMLRQMGAQLNYTRQRAGWSLEAASIGEDL